MKKCPKSEETFRFFFAENLFRYLIFRLTGDSLLPRKKIGSGKKSFEAERNEKSSRNFLMGTGLTAAERIRDKVPRGEVSRSLKLTALELPFLPPVAHFKS